VKTTDSVSIESGIVGLGLIGGSLAKALRAFVPGCRITVADLCAETVQAALSEGVADAAVDPRAADFETAFDGCDVLFICTPPQETCRLLGVFHNARIGVVTDVASVKRPILKAAAGMANFIGGHPMAGSEGSGYGAAETTLFQRATYVLCVPGDCALPAARLEAFKALIARLGGRVVTMPPDMHDHRVAIISHLPHVAAFALAGIADDARDDALRTLIGGGFRDTTRIAASSPGLWTDIFLASEPLVPAIDDYIAHLVRLRDLVAAGDAETLREWLKQASDFRASIPEGLRRAAPEPGGEKA
jgi:prephenate dehydrogenase